MSYRPVSQNAPRQSLKSNFAAAFHYTEPANGSRQQTSSRPASAASASSPFNAVSPRRRAAQLAGMNGYNATTDLPPPLYVRALYDYDADDQTSLSFRQGDIIQVITQLESGWWDGVIRNVRGWFPSNYCTVISADDPDGTIPEESEQSAESGTEEEFDEDDSDSHIQDDEELPIEGSKMSTQEEAAFWVPQATPDGRLFYFNTLTGVSTMELPMEAPTAVDETGPRDRNFFVPSQTRPPPEMMAGGYERDDDSASDADGARSFLSTGRKTSASVSTSASTTSTKVETDSKLAVYAASPAARPLRASVTAGIKRNSAPKYFADDGIAPPLTWNNLIENMQASVEAYRDAVENRERAELVRRAEDVSDHLRILLAAGSGTTDNHSGNPSIISTNKALYPHFREMMSKFSKLVLSSHMAAADWPGQDNFIKCLQEADGVLNGVYGYVEVARQQQGEDLPRLVPGFALGSKIGGNWRDNNIDQSVENTSFIDSDNDIRQRPSIALDGNVIQQLDNLRRSLVSSIRAVEDNLVLSQKLVTPSQQAALGDKICMAAGVVINQFRPWISLVESIDLSPLGSVFQRPTLTDFGTQKQKVYDSIGDLVACCQEVTVPLPDEWSKIRGDSLDTRLASVKGVCKQLENSISHVGYALQLLTPTPGSKAATDSAKRDHRLTDGGETYQSQHRTDAGHLAHRPGLAELGQSKSYTAGYDSSLDESRRQATNNKAQRFFGQVPPELLPPSSDSASGQEDIPWFLQLDHLGEVTYDMKASTAQVKAGTLMGLVEQLTRHDRSDTTYINTFLLTYRSFTTAEELFQLLVARFNIQAPNGLKMEEYKIWEDKKQKPVRFRVVNTLKSWLETYWMEDNDADSQALLNKIGNFTTNTMESIKIAGQVQIVNLVNQRLKGEDTSAKKMVFMANSPAPSPILPKNMKKLKFLDIVALEFARQLTIMESKLYSRIKAVEFLDKTWQKKNTKGHGQDPAPNVKALILHSNQLTNWVAEMILQHPEVKKRVAVIKHFVAIAEKCLTLNNFSSLTAIVSAMGTAPILRLARTWAQVPAKTTNMLESMRNLIASTKNFGQYREALHAANPPCIPFLGVFLTDLVFIEDGIPSVVKNSELINFTKRTKTAEVIREIQQYQTAPYPLNPVPELQNWILDNMRVAEIELPPRAK
ncbi:hypothetical protein DV738_g4323, partial [Chaetothyriales sp. CBS 135597]